MYYIVTDTSTDMPLSWIEAQHDFVMMSLSCTRNGESFIPGASDEEKKDVYDQLRNGVVIKTSAINTATWEESFQKLLADGHDVFCIAFSSGLSSTYSSAKDAAKGLSAKYPNRKLIVVDSLCASAGEGLLVYYALKNREQGMSIEENAAWIQSHIQNLVHWFTVDDLMFLYRGGRLSATSAMLGSLIRIKPILHVDEQGHLAMVEKVAGRRRSIRMLANKVKEHIVNPEGQMIFISHGDCEEEANSLADMIKAEIPGIAGIQVSYIGSVIGSHSGPGTLAVFFLGDCR